MPDYPVIHTFPNALVAFVKGFRSNPTTDSQVVIAQSFGDIREISQLAVSLTCKNSPGTFSLTLVDTANKFIIPDYPDQEIQNMFSVDKNQRIQTSYSQINQSLSKGGKVVTTKSSGSTVTRAANYYQFPNYDSWASFVEGVVEDLSDSRKYTVSYTTDNNGNVIERFAIDRQGNIIIIPLASQDSTNGFIDNDLSQSGQNFQYKVYPSPSSSKKGASPSYKTYRLWKYRNDEIFTRYKSQEQGTDPQTFKFGKCSISPMDRVVIFTAAKFNDDGSFDQTPDGRMLRVFTGIVNTVQQSYQQQQNMIQIQGEDVTKLMRLSILNVNPALFSDKIVIPDQTQTDALTVWSTILLGMTPPEIIELLTVGGISKGKPGSQPRRILGIGEYVITGEKSQGDLYFHPNSNTYNTTVPQGQSPASSTVKNRVASFKSMLGDLFTHNTVHIIDPFESETNLEGFTPYKLNMNTNWSFYQGDFKVRRDIAYQVSEDTGFNFYADRNGEIWFTPQRFDITHILSARIPNAYVIDDLSIVSYGFIEDDTNVYSSVYVSTDPDLGEASLQELGLFTAAYRDDDVMLKYGQRLFTIHNPLLRARTADSKSIYLYAKSIMQRILAGRYQGQITITYRPEIEPNHPIYVPCRNMIYYVETVEHNIQFGASATTTLSLSYGRKPWDLLPERLSFANNDHVYRTDGQLKQSVPPKKGSTK